MRIAIVGLGAVGGLMAARLAAAGRPVSALARGETLRVVREQGLRLVEAGGEESLQRIEVAGNPAELGVQDLVVVALKAPALPALAPGLAPLIGPDTIVLTAMNGVPWWFLQTPRGTGGLPPEARRLASVDPQGRTEAALPLARVLAGVVHWTSSTPRPGVVRHGFGRRLIVGEPAGGVSERVRRVAAVLGESGLQVEPGEDIRQDLWFKLWGNMTMNPVSALTLASCDRIHDDPLVAAFVLRAMAEAAEVGARIGCPIHQSGEERMAITRQLGAFKTSMLQDVEAGRPLELDALVGAVHEIGRKLGLATPNIDALLGLTRLMAASRGLGNAEPAGR
ncbi:2-dehydropantoate 2-reductase [Caldimonas tepidiphila]|uniref:2-dehydropantoate 2-reductase n=1 Tax=Caldimonas tepidiphila TaxID=2315841 RepID=UPI000E5AD05E|nr:2-dehydropantoate 2-reductase [Caldimonas tepidiphila]